LIAKAVALIGAYIQHRKSYSDGEMAVAKGGESSVVTADQNTAASFMLLLASTDITNGQPVCPTCWLRANQLQKAFSITVCFDNENR
ncbi:jg20095, partial [Pararge aegeria aegeria]